jgi:hypothetical protein
MSRAGLERWLHGRAARRPVAASMPLLDGYVAAIVAAPVSISPLDWICRCSPSTPTPSTTAARPVAAHPAALCGRSGQSAARTGKERSRDRGISAQRHTDIPALVEATRQYWMLIRYARAG